MAAGGFKFGSASAGATSGTGGGVLGGGGFSFGGASTATKPGGLSFGTPAAAPATTQAAGGFKFGATPSTGGLQLGAAGAAAAPTAAKGFSFGATPATSTTAPATGFSLGGLGGTSTGTGLQLGGTTTSTGLSLGGTSTGTGLSLGGASTGSTGFSLGGAKPATGFSLGGTSTGTGLSLGGTAGTGLTFGGTSTTATGLTLGGTTTTTTSSSGLALGVVAPTTKVGLGGIDPSTLSSSSATATSSTSSDSTNKGQVVKETDVPQPIYQNVKSFKEYVKTQKARREEILRFSDKPLQRVREETEALHRLLGQASSCLQRSSASVRKLKEQSAQQLQDVEIAQRTREIPAALQLEYTAPADYFQRQVYQFEQDMVLCRHQIEQMESFMAALDQPASYSPQELSNIMVKLNETFVALAAQLQSVHEIVKAQKEQYLTYRRVYQGESEDVFSARRKMALKQTRARAQPKGPQPFGQYSNMALVMATALQSAQKPAGMGGGLQTSIGTNPTLGGTAGGLGTTGTGLGGTASTFGTGFGAGFQNKGFGTTTSGFGTTGGGLGSTLGATSTFGGASATTGLFGSKPTAASAPGFNFGGSLSAGPTLGTPSGNTSFGGFGSTPASTFGQTTTGKPLQLQKPPSKHRKTKDRM